MKTVHCLFLSKSLLSTQNTTSKIFRIKKKIKLYCHLNFLFVDECVLANSDLFQSDLQNSPSQFQEHINQGFKNDEFQSGKDS